MERFQFSRKRKWIKALLFLCLIIVLIYGSVRLYFEVTGGFCLSNITSDFAYDSRWEIKKLSDAENFQIEKILSQPFTYLGKGCQSYVFVSEDGENVIKFFKYQRFRPQFWIHYFTFIPAVSNYYSHKLEKKKQKLEMLFKSWKIAFEELQPETGLVYVHLNKNEGLPNHLIIYDKLGMKHVLNMNHMEFLIQKKADMLCPTIEKLMTNNEIEKAKNLISRLIATIISEYRRGLADNDHALMQNTGVFKGNPVHIDVGQFMKDAKVKEPKFYHQELFNKTYKFRIWLRKRYPILLQHVDAELQNELGNSFFQLKHVPKPH